MTLSEELRLAYYKAYGKYSAGVKSEWAQEEFAADIFNVVVTSRPVFFNLYDGVFTGEWSGLGSGSLSNLLLQACEYYQQNVILRFYENGSLREACKVLANLGSYYYVLRSPFYYDGGNYIKGSAPRLGVYKVTSFGSHSYNQLVEIDAPSMGLVFDVTDIFNTPSNSEDWGTSGMITKLDHLQSKVKSNGFFSVQDEGTLQPYPVKIFLKTVAGELADEIQYDFYKFIDFSKYEHLRVISNHSSASTIGRYKVLLRETKETGLYDCTWAWRLNQGDEAPADKVDELRNAIDNGRTLFTKYTNKDGYDSHLGILADHRNDDDTSVLLYSVNRFGLSWIVIDDSSDDYDYSVSARGTLNFQEKLVSGTNIKTINGQSLLGAGDIVTDNAVICALPDVFGGTSAEFFANLKELYDAGTLKLNNIYYGNTELTDIVAGLAVQEMRVEVLPDDGGQVVFSAVATTSTYDDSLKPFRWETQSLNGGFTKWVGRATQDSIPTKVSELANDAGYAKAAVIETFTDASEISVTCESGKIRQGSNIATLTIGCAATDNSAAEERIIFSTGSSVEGVTVTGVSWANGDTPSFKANKVYEISVCYVPLLGKFLATYAEY